RPFLVGERKLGLGRSSATLVAAVAAFLATRGRPTREGILERALAANALFQEGRGSGADLAAAVHGGVVEVCRQDAGLRVQSRALRRLVATARRVGAVAKPSGAGAGDCGIALAESAAQAARVRSAWQEAGIVPLAIAIAPDGVTGG